VEEKSINKVEDYFILQKALDSFEDGFLIVNESIIEYCNKSLADLIGYTTEEIIGKPKDYYVSEIYKPIINKYHEMKLSGQLAPKQYKIEIVTKSNEIIPVLVSVGIFNFYERVFTVILVKNIQEQIAREEDYLKKEVQFREIFDNTEIFICLCDLEGKIIVSNSSFDSLFGFLQETTGDINLKYLFNDERISKYFDEVEKNPKEKPKLNLSIKFDFESKSKWFNTYLNVIKYKETTIGILFSMTDISKEIELQSKNEFKKLLLQNLMNSFPESIYFKDEFSRFIQVNKATLEKFNLKSFDEIIGKTDFELFESEHALQARDDEIKLLNGEVDFIRNIEKETFKDKKIKWVLTTKIPLKDNQGKIFGTVGISRDITEIRKNELILEALFKISSAVTKVENLQQLFFEIHSIVKTLMKADNFYIALVDWNSNIISFPYFVDKYDSQPQPRKLKKGLTEYILRIKEPMLIDRKKDFELRLKGETELIGEPSAIWLGVPLKINDNVIGVIVIQDYEDENTYGIEEREILTYVSEQIALAINKLSDEQKLKSYSNELKELIATKDKLFSIISHDLKSPIQGIMGLSELLVEDVDILSPEEIKEDLKEINNAVKMLYKLIENLLDWSRFQTGRMQLKPVTLNAFILVDNVINPLLQTAKLKNIKINNNINPSHFIIGDENLLHSLFHNLISNSIKFTNLNGEINVNSKISDDKIFFEVTDNGIGISPENIEKIFKFDSSLTTSGTSNERGTGLGLVLCKEIVTAHKGNIKLTSEVGKGTKISFDLIKSN
jgi:PAS domain S-box-containing protein